MKTQKGATVILIVIILLATVLFASGYIALKNGKITRGTPTTKPIEDLVQKPKEVKETIAAIVPAPEANFSKDGDLLDQRQDPEVERWIFLYGEPGNPAVTVELKFNFRSKCDLGQGENICNTERFPKQIRVHIEGNLKDKVLTVQKMKTLE